MLMLCPCCYHFMLRCHHSSHWVAMRCMPAPAVHIAMYSADAKRTCRRKLARQRQAEHKAEQAAKQAEEVKRLKRLKRGELEEQCALLACPCSRLRVAGVGHSHSVRAHCPSSFEEKGELSTTWR